MPVQITRGMKKQKTNLQDMDKQEHHDHDYKVDEDQIHEEYHLHGEAGWFVLVGEFLKQVGVDTQP